MPSPLPKLEREPTLVRGRTLSGSGYRFEPPLPRNDKAKKKGFPKEAL